MKVWQRVLKLIALDCLSLGLTLLKVLSLGLSVLGVIYIAVHCDTFATFLGWVVGVVFALLIALMLMVYIDGVQQRIRRG